MSNKIVSSFGVVTGVIKGSPARVFSVYAHNLNAAVRYVQLYNQASGAPSGTPVAEFLLPVTAGAVNIGPEFFHEKGTAFTVGVVYGFSTTSGSYVAGTAANHRISVCIDAQLET